MNISIPEANKNYSTKLLLFLVHERKKLCLPSITNLFIYKNVLVMYKEGSFPYTVYKGEIILYEFCFTSIPVTLLHINQMSLLIFLTNSRFSFRYLSKY